MHPTLREQIAVTAARLVVEEGLEYGPAKQRALKLLGKRGLPSGNLPGNDLLEAEVRAYLAIFCADTQPGELAQLRRVALTWMERLAAFRPHLTGAVWRGTATCSSGVHLQLYCDDPKSAEIALLEQRIAYEVGSIRGPRAAPIDVLSFAHREPGPPRAAAPAAASVGLGGAASAGFGGAASALGQRIFVYLSILDHDDLRGALKPDAHGRALRGDAKALRQLMENTP